MRATALTKQFGTVVALRSIDLSLNAGEVTAIMGPSGCGKSTLLLCLAGIIQPDSGAVYFHNSDLGAMGEVARSRLRRSDFGVLFQFGQLIPELSNVENVALPLMFSGARRRDATSVARDALETLGVGPIARARASDISGGQAQRVALARAMVTNPQVLFADEPTGALDSTAGGRVLDKLASIATNGRTAVLLVTHDPKVATIADRVVTMEDGMIVADSYVA